MTKLLHRNSFCGDAFRGSFRALLLLSLLSCQGGQFLAAEEAPSAKRLNVLLITADDLNFDSLGVTGCKTPDISPNLDRLAKQGLLFRHAHVNIAVCQPCREVLMTGRYPHRNGGMGFQPIREDVPTLGEQLKSAGYYQGILAKVSHLAPQPKFCWDMVVTHQKLAGGRSAQKYGEHAAKFFAAAAAEKKPFFLMANAQDPHRPFAGSDQEGRRRNFYPQPTRVYQPKEVEVPKFLPDLPEVRREIAEYYTSVHRCDEVVGAVLAALDESGMADQTLVMFLSDHGMALPFAKTNCYLHSTRTPWMVRWPGVVKGGSEDQEHFISTIDFLPTVLAATGLKPLEGIDGRSFLPVLRGEEQAGRERVYTRFHQTSAGNNYAMRSVVEAKFGYIYNGWSNGKATFRNESQSGRTFKAMAAAAASDGEIAERVNLFEHRVPEELFNYQTDPDALHNLAGDPFYEKQLVRLRKELAVHLDATQDPAAARFKRQFGK